MLLGGSRYLIYPVMTTPDLTYGLCQTGEYPADLWHPKSALNRKLAKLICSECPLLGPCRKYAIEQYPLHGSIHVVVGGLTTTEIRLRREKLGIRIDRADVPPPTPRIAPRKVIGEREPYVPRDQRQLTMYHKRGKHDGPDQRREYCPLCAAADDDDQTGSTEVVS